MLVINPGGFYFGQGSERLRTLLGSCVAITLWHPVRKAGGMCHYLLPSAPVDRTGELDGRYGDHALQLFQQELKRMRALPKEFEVKLFGGGNMFPMLAGRSSGVGARNIAAAEQMLEKAGFEVRARHVGNVGHRTVVLDLATGETWIRCQQ